MVRNKIKKIRKLYRNSLDSVVGKSIMLLVFFSIIGIPLGWCVYSYVYHYFRHRELVIYGVHTEGNVIDVIHRGYYPIVEFVDKEGNIHIHKSSLEFRCKIGDKLSVIYLPEQPNIVAEIENAASALYNFNVTSIISFLVLFLFVLFYFFILFYGIKQMYYEWTH